MKRTVSLMLTMVLLFSILVGCNNNGASDISSDLSEVTSSSTEQVDSNFETTEVESTTTESGIQEENSTVSNSETTNTTTKPSANSNNSQTTKPNTNSTTSNTTTKPSTSNSTTGNNNSSSSNTNNSTVEDNYVYRNPTVYVDGMYTINDSKVTLKKQLYMGDVYVEKKYVEKQHTYGNKTMNKVVKFDASHIVTDVNKMPSNYKLYAYVVDTIPNWLYEKNISLSACKNSTPLEMYFGYCSTEFNRALEYISEFYWSIGCISYDDERDTIKTGNLKSAIYMPYHDPIDYSELDEYESYVKTNKIKLTTVAEPLLPIIYATNDLTFIRTKITVKAESPVTNNIKMFLHNGLTLKNGENVFYIDVPLSYVNEIVSNENGERDILFVPMVYIDEKDLSKYIIA